MFGFAKHEKLAKAIDAFMDLWLTVQVIDAALAGVRGPPPQRLAYFGILWGVTDSIAQLQGLDMDTTVKGLKKYLAQFSDGSRIFTLVVAAPRNPELLPWINLAGLAARSIAGGSDPNRIFG